MPNPDRDPHESEKDSSADRDVPAVPTHNDIEVAHNQPRRTRASDKDRDKVANALSQAMAAGELTAVEFDERHSQALSATYIDQLPQLIDDIQGARELVRELQAVDQIDSATASGTGSQVANRPKQIPPAKPGSGEPETAFCVLGGSNKVVPADTPEINGLALMGGNEYDMCDVLGPGVEITVNSFNIMGGHEFYVPPGVRVIDKSVSILGGNDLSRFAQGDGSQGTLIIRGFNLMGGNDVKLARGYRNNQ